MSLLTMVQSRVADRIGIPRPATLVDNADPDARLLLTLANDVGQNLSNMNWQCLLKFATFTSVATQLQGDMLTIAPDFARQEGETLWNLTNATYSRGPLTPQEWQLATARRVAGPYARFQIRQNPTTLQRAVYFDVVPDAGKTMSFAYWSKNWCYTSGTPAIAHDVFTTDADELLDGFASEQTFAMGIRAYWKREKGLAFEDDMADFLQNADLNLAQNRPQMIASMTPVPPTLLLGEENVQEGNWPQ